MLSSGIEIAYTSAAEWLNQLLAHANRDSAKVIEQGDIPTVVAYFAELRDKIQDLERRATALTKHVETLSKESIPTLFTNQNVKSINVIGLGRATINVHWSASMPDKEKAFEWLRSTGNQGLIIETVNAKTLGAFAKIETLAGRPLPPDTFKVSTSAFVSITPA
jgi:hypothetical protein